MTHAAHNQAPGPAPRLLLHTKITLLVVILLSVCMCLFSYVSYSAGRRAREHQAQAEMRRTASLIASFNTQDQAPDWPHIHTFVGNTMSLYAKGEASDLLELIYIVIKDETGAPRACAFHHGLMSKHNIHLTNPAGEPVDEYNYADSARDINLDSVSAPGLNHLTMDITVNGRKRGVIQMGYLVKNLARQERAILMRTLAVLCGLLAFGMAMAILLSRHMMRPVLDVVHAMDRVADGDLSVRVEPHNRDETRLLVQGFNSMAGHIEQSRADLNKKACDLAESELKYRGVVDNANDGIGILQAGALRFANNRFAEIVGESRDNLADAAFIHFVAPGERTRFTEILDRFISGAARRQLVETALIRADGNRVHVELNITAVTWNGAPAGLVYARDVTKRKQAEAEKDALQAQLLQAQKMEAVGTLAGGVAHDFNNLLAVILGIADLALIGRSPRDPDYINYKKIVDISHKARELTMRLLTFARKDKLNIETLNIDVVVNDLADILRRTLSRKILVETRSAECSLPVKMDANQIQQALLNICLNAGDAMPQGGRLILETSLVPTGGSLSARGADMHPGPCCLVEITDSGPGVPQEIRDKIFEPFFTTKSRGKGTGLGLFTTLGIINNHGGRAEVADAPGGGCAFRVYLPLGRSEHIAPRQDNRAGAQVERASGSETILVIDDEPDLLELAQEALDTLGYDVLTAGSGAQGIDVFRMHAAHINLVILDMIMPDLDGSDVFHTLRAIDPQAHVALCSGFSNNGSAEDLLGQGALGFLQKPFSIKTLSEFVRGILDKNAHGS
jgi:PAS domain S-box-containing protein